MQNTKRSFVLILGVLSFFVMPYNFATTGLPNPAAEALAATPEIPVTFKAGPLEPFLGQEEITVRGQVDILNKTFRLSAKFLEGGASKKVGPVTISDLEVSISNATGLSVMADATLLGKTAKLGLKELTQNIAVFNISFDPDNIPSFLIMPQKRIKLTSVDLIFEKGVPPKVRTRTMVLGQEVEIDLSKEETAISLEDIKLVDIFPELQSNATVRNVIFKKLELKTEARTAEKVEVSIDGKVNFSSMPMEDVEEDVSDLEFFGSISKAKGLLFQANLKSVKLPFAGDIENAHFIFNVGGEKDIIEEEENHEGYKLVLGGTAKISIPHLGNNVGLTLEAEYKNGYFAISGELDTEAKIGTVTIKKPKLKISRQNVIFFISGESNVPDFNLTVDGQLQLDFDLAVTKAVTQGTGGANYRVKFEGKVAAIEPYKPFKDSSIEVIKSIELREATVRIEFASETAEPEDIKRAISLVGKTKVLEQDCTAQLKLIETGEGERGFALKAKVDAAWKFSSTFPSLQGTSVEDVELSDVYFIASTLKYNDPVLAITLQPGLMLYAGVESSGIMTNADSLVSGGMEKLGIYGKINLREFAVGVNIPNVINFKEGPVRSGGVRFEISGPEDISIAFLTSITVAVNEEDTLLFTGRIELDPEKAIAAMTMEGFWNNPFKIMGLSIGDLALQADFDYKVAAAGIPLSGLGVAGKIYIGEKDPTKEDDTRKFIELALHITADPDQNILKGKLSSLYLSDVIKLVDSMRAKVVQLSESEIAQAVSSQIDTTGVPVSLILEKMQSPIDVSKLPEGELGFKDLEIFIAPEGGQIGELTYPAGFTLKGKMMLFKEWEAMVNVTLSSSGIIILGSAKEINLHNLLVITGAGPDQIKETEDDGPIIDIALSLFDQHFFISGEVNLLGVSRRVDISFDEKGLSFETEMKLWNLWNGLIEVRSEGNIEKPSEWDLKFEASLRDDFKEFFKAQFAKLAEGEVEKARERLVVVEAEMEVKRAEVLKDRQSALDELQKAQDNLDVINNNIATNNGKIQERQDKIDEAAKKIDDADWYRKVDVGTVGGAKIAAWATEIAAFETANATQKAAKVIAEEVLKAASAVVGGLATVDLDPRVSPLMVERDALKSFIAGGEPIAGSISQVLSAIMDTFSIQNALFKGSFKEMRTGVMPLLELDLTAAGKEKHISMQFDFKNPVSSARSIGEAIIQLFK